MQNKGTEDKRRRYRRGAIPQNVNYAVKSGFVLPFVENIPEIKHVAKPAYKVGRKS
jgi:hypothetical protein